MLLLTIVLIVHQLCNCGLVAAGSASEEAWQLLPDECGPLNGKVNYTQGSTYQSPWVAAIGYGGIFKCVGSIITSRYILTSAFCVADNDNVALTVVRVGEPNIRHIIQYQPGLRDGVQDIYATEKIIHEHFDKRLRASDFNIALLRLQRDINFNFPNVDTICLPDMDESHVDNVLHMGKVSAWGYFHERTAQTVRPWPRSENLRQMDFPMVSRLDCQNSYWLGSRWNVVINTNEFCAGGSPSDACFADNGAPLVVQGEYNCAARNIQYGIVARGLNYCNRNNPIMFTDVRKHMDWIIDNIRP